MMIPVGEKVVVKVIEEEVKPGILILPDSAKDKETWFKVVSIGKNSPVKVGDEVLISGYPLSKLKMDGEFLYVFDNEHIQLIRKVVDKCEDERG